VQALAPGSKARRVIEAAFRRATGKPAEMAVVAQRVYEVMQGRPSDYFVRHAYFKSGLAKPEIADPDRDDIGKIWIAPVVPMRGRDVVAALHRLETVFKAHDFDFYVALLAQNSRTLIVLMCIFSRRLIRTNARVRKRCTTL